MSGFYQLKNKAFTMVNINNLRVLMELCWVIITWNI